MLEREFIVDDWNIVFAYCHDWYYTRNDPRNTMRYLTDLKNDIPPYRSMAELQKSEKRLAEVLRADFKKLVARHGQLTVCGVPRSKRENGYPYSQMGLKRTIRAVVNEIPELADGMDYIIRHTDTVCTHRDRARYGGAGERPRPGLLKDTCRLSTDIRGRDILLVDDIYTANVGIDEDAIQAMYDMGAKSVIFYAVGCTWKRENGFRFCA